MARGDSNESMDCNGLAGLAIVGHRAVALARLVSPSAAGTRTGALLGRETAFGEGPGVALGGVAATS